MPHQCTGCGHAFEDGSKEMLSGCPECGGNTFQFLPEGVDPLADPGDATPSDGPAGPADPQPGDDLTGPGRDAGTVAETVGRATTRVRDLVSSGPEPPSGRPDAGPSDDGSPDATPPATPSDTEPPGDGSAGTDVDGVDVSRESTAAPDPERSWPGETDGEQDPDRTSGDDTDGEIIDADARRESGADDGPEDLAQSSARTDVVSERELEDVSPPAGSGADTSTTGTAPGASDGPSDGDDAVGPRPADQSRPEVDADSEVVSRPSGEDPDLAELREQLNDQFESIKILEPGQYELNLMELYDREEYIIALQENGRYVIQVPEQWIGTDPDDR